MKKRFVADTLEDLTGWLDKFSIPHRDWGNGQSKSIHNLFHELQQGECWLLEDSPIRILSVVQLLIFQRAMVLVEKEQLMDNDRIRTRFMPPSEKMKPDEDWREAALRCLEEELQIPPEDATILSTAIRAKIRNKISVSYPGLSSRYYLYQVEVSVNTLPDVDFWTIEKDDTDVENVIGKHKWGWANPEAIQLLSERSLSEPD